MQDQKVSEATSAKRLAESQRVADEVIARVNKSDDLRDRMAAAMSGNDKGAVQALLSSLGLKIGPDDRITVDGWSARYAKGGPGGAQPLLYRCTRYVYMLEASWDPWNGLDWHVVEYCAALQEI